MRSDDIFFALLKLDLVHNIWWKMDDEQMIISVILTQQSKWEKVLLSLENLKKANINLQNLQKQDLQNLATLIRPSGLFNQKAARLKMLSQNIFEDFEDLGEFKKNVTRKWLLAQKGIGKESADSILNYLCKRDIMVVDAYTARLLKKLDFIFDDYDEIQQWLEEGIYAKLDEIMQKTALQTYEIFSLFHAMIVEFSKQKINIKALDL